MALPINVFRSVTAKLTSTPSLIYTAPINNTAIVLMAQAANVDDTDAYEVTFELIENPAGIETRLVKDFSVPPNDAATLITGKLIVAAGNQLRASTSTDDKLELTLSILESRNA
jgi:hypothetical protein